MNDSLVPCPGGWMRASRVTDDVSPGKPSDWDAADWLDPEAVKAIRWYGLSEDEKRRARELERAMNRATGTNPLAH